MGVPLQQVVVQELVELVDFLVGEAEHLRVDVGVEDVGVDAEHLGDAVQVLPAQLCPLAAVHHLVEEGEDLLAGQKDLPRVLLLVLRQRDEHADQFNDLELAARGDGLFDAVGVGAVADDPLAHLHQELHPEEQLQLLLRLPRPVPDQVVEVVERVLVETTAHEHQDRLLLLLLRVAQPLDPLRDGGQGKSVNVRLEHHYNDFKSPAVI